MQTENIEILSLLKKLQHIQQEHFVELNGLFPSHRYHPFGYRRKDYSAYFSATLLHSLTRLGGRLNNSESKILEEIRLKACKGVSPFQNKQGLERFNFWQTNPGRHFPNGILLGRWDYFRPPDDVDDSVMIYQMQNRTYEDSIWLKQHIDSYANGSRKWINNSPRAYKKLRAVCTFFSKNMPLGFDACVICNVLYFNFFHGFDKSDQDLDSMRFLTLMLDRKDHLSVPQKVSPYYPHTSIIFYHLVKLIERFNPMELRPFRSQIQKEIENLLKTSLLPQERTLLESAFMWLSGKIPPVENNSKRKGSFYFFVLPLTLEFEGWLPQWIAHNRISHIRFECEALEIALKIENQVLRRSIH